jgi:hypothetical protein
VEAEISFSEIHAFSVLCNFIDSEKHAFSDLINFLDSEKHEFSEFTKMMQSEKHTFRILRNSENQKSAKSENGIWYFRKRVRKQS